jgi:hypothetical protein
MLRYLSENPEFFDPQTIEVMSGALDEAWERVRRSGARLDSQDRAARNALAKHIVDLAREGERDRQHLIEGALLRWRSAHYRPDFPLWTGRR